MALVRIAAGAELDIASGDELAGVKNSILDAFPTEPRPIYLTRSDAEIAVAGNTFVQIDLGSPPVGSMWQLRFITMFGADDHTTVGGVTAGAYCGNPANISLAQLKVPNMAIPSLTFIPDTCMWCHPSENLVIRTSTTVTAGQQIGAVVGIEEWLQDDVARLSGKGSR